MDDIRIRPLVWEELSPTHFRAAAPLFGNLRVESYGDDWSATWSAPGYCDNFLTKRYLSAEAARVAVQEKYDALILACVENPNSDELEPDDAKS